mmetsp:Transcript_7800/g.19355  ORF Transcript_7800/g.19355 Transcript_7800/m.19355 type:complete len:220 (+) Transcript_7800:2304-2963(+)
MKIAIRVPPTMERYPRRLPIMTYMTNLVANDVQRGLVPRHAVRDDGARCLPRPPAYLRRIHVAGRLGNLRGRHDVYAPSIRLDRPRLSLTSRRVETTAAASARGSSSSPATYHLRHRRGRRIQHRTAMALGGAVLRIRPLGPVRIFRYQRGVKLRLGSDEGVELGLYRFLEIHRLGEGQAELASDACRVLLGGGGCGGGQVPFDRLDEVRYRVPRREER